MAIYQSMPWWRIATDWIVGTILVVCTLWAEYLQNPRQQGYFCDDRSIQFPVPEYETVPSVYVYTIGPILGVLAIIATEFHNKRLSSNDDNLGFTFTLGTRRVKISPILRNVYYFAGFYGLGAANGLLTVDLMKVTTGRLRPYFVSQCKPANETLAFCQENPTGYVSSPNCTNDAYAVYRARLSFPSGHAGFCFYAAIYMSCYLHERGRWTDVSGSSLVKYAVRMLLFLAAVVISISRVTDRAHHVTDVLAGGTLGTLLGCATSYAVFPIGWPECGCGEKAAKKIDAPSPTTVDPMERVDELSPLVNNRYEACVMDASDRSGARHDD